MKKILDIFSYVPSTTLSLEEIDRAFNDRVNCCKTSSMEFSFAKQVQRKDMQEAIKALETEGKEIALVKVNGKEIAIVGFVEK